MRYVCAVCNYVYDPEIGDPEGGIEATTRFTDLPRSWVCPDCEVTKEQFYPCTEAEEARL